MWRKAGFSWTNTELTGFGSENLIDTLSDSANNQGGDMGAWDQLELNFDAFGYVVPNSYSFNFRKYHKRVMVVELDLGRA